MVYKEAGYRWNWVNRTVWRQRGVEYSVVEGEYVLEISENENNHDAAHAIQRPVMVALKSDRMIGVLTEKKRWARLGWG